METTIIICLSLALVIAIGMIIAIEVYYRKINKLINWVKFPTGSGSGYSGTE